MALTFYKHFVLAPRYGQPLPAIDWSADNSTVLTAISQVQDEAVRELLAKEFQARRMVASSLAQVQEQARHPGGEARQGPGSGQEPGPEDTGCLCRQVRD